MFEEYPVPTPAGGPAGITAGPDGAIWFTELDRDKIGRITVPVPASKDQCKREGWRQLRFTNQGQCVAFVQRGPKP
jgi:streptogramin lyase